MKGINQDSLSGLPALFFPFKLFLERGHQVDLLLFTLEKNKSFQESERFKKENLIVVHLYGNRYHDALLINQTVKKQLLNKHYDFVYGMGEGTQIGLCAAQKKGIPCGLRQYGVQEMTNVLEQIPSVYGRRFKAVRSYPYITLSLITRKSLLLATNDGSRADKLFELLGIRSKKFPFFFWTSGIEIPSEQPKTDACSTNSYPYKYDSSALSHISRIADVKRQDRSVSLLAALHRKGYPFHLYLVGEVSSEKMLQSTMELIESNRLQNFVHFEGGKTQKECRAYARNSFATILPCEWNRVNVFYEAMSEGSVIITNNNHSIDEFIEDGMNCLVYEEDDYEQAADRIISLVKDSQKAETIREAAFRTAKEKFFNAEKRFGIEVQLVEDVVMGKDIGQFPEIL